MLGEPVLLARRAHGDEEDVRLGLPDRARRRPRSPRRRSSRGGAGDDEPRVALGQPFDGGLEHVLLRAEDVDAVAALAPPARAAGTSGRCRRRARASGSPRSREAQTTGWPSTLTSSQRSTISRRRGSSRRATILATLTDTCWAGPPDSISSAQRRTVSSMSRRSMSTAEDAGPVRAVAECARRTRELGAAGHADRRDRSGRPERGRDHVGDALGRRARPRAGSRTGAGGSRRASEGRDRGRVVADQGVRALG